MEKNHKCRRNQGAQSTSVAKKSLKSCDLCDPSSSSCGGNHDLHKNTFENTFENAQWRKITNAGEIKAHNQRLLPKKL